MESSHADRQLAVYLIMADNTEFRLGALTAQAEAVGNEVQILRRENSNKIDALRQELLNRIDAMRNEARAENKAVSDHVNRVAESAGLFTPKIAQLERADSMRKGFKSAMWPVITTVASIIAYLIGAFLGGPFSG